MRKTILLLTQSQLLHLLIYSIPTLYLSSINVYIEYITVWSLVHWINHFSNLFQLNHFTFDTFGIAPSDRKIRSKRANDLPTFVRVFRSSNDLPPMIRVFKRATSAQDELPTFVRVFRRKRKIQRRDEQPYIRIMNEDSGNRRFRRQSDNTLPSFIRVFWRQIGFY